MAHLKFPHHRKAFWNFLTILLGEDSKLQNDRMDAMMSTFYNYSEFLLKLQKTEQTVTAKTAMLLQFRRGKVNVFFLNYHLLR